MSDDAGFRLVLVERIEEYIDESGVARPTSKDKNHSESERHLSELKALLGSPSVDAHVSLTKGGGHAFGGHEMMNSVHEVIFVLATSGVIKGAFTTLKSWVDLRKSRSIELEMTDKAGKKKRISVKATNEKTIERIVQQFLRSQHTEEVSEAAENMTIKRTKGAGEPEAGKVPKKPRQKKDRAAAKTTGS